MTHLPQEISPALLRDHLTTMVPYLGRLLGPYFLGETWHWGGPLDCHDIKVVVLKGRQC